MKRQKNTLIVRNSQLAGLTYTYINIKFESMLILNHKKLVIWNKCLLLVKEVYKLTDELPAEERFGLTSQMRKAVVSISSNISEGASRSSEKERKRFYEISRSSLVELDTQLEISLILGFLPRKKFS